MTANDILQAICRDEAAINIQVLAIDDSTINSEAPETETIFTYTGFAKTRVRVSDLDVRVVLTFADDDEYKNFVDALDKSEDVIIPDDHTRIDVCTLTPTDQDEAESIGYASGYISMTAENPDERKVQILFQREGFGCFSMDLGDVLAQSDEELQDDMTLVGDDETLADDEDDDDDEEGEE